MTGPAFTSADDIREAVDAGLPVKWANDGYDVIRDRIGQYLIQCEHNGSCIGLTWADGQTLNGDLGDFYVADA